MKEESDRLKMCYFEEMSKEVEQRKPVIVETAPGDGDHYVYIKWEERSLLYRYMRGRGNG